MVVVFLLQRDTRQVQGEGELLKPDGVSLFSHLRHQTFFVCVALVYVPREVITGGVADKEGTTSAGLRLCRVRTKSAVNEDVFDLTRVRRYVSSLQRM